MNMDKKKTYRVLTFILFLVFLCAAAYAGEKQWSGKGDGASWEDTSNWYPEGIPAASDDISIDATGVASGADVLASRTFSVKSLTVGGKKESVFTSADFVYGTISPAQKTDDAIYIRKEGSVTLKGVGEITLKGSFKNSEESLASEPAFMFQLE